MKTGASISRRARNSSGISLIECLVYIAVFFVLTNVALVAYYRCFDTMRGLRKNADDIVNVLHAGERWREDIRSATGPIREQGEGREMRIPKSATVVQYRFQEGTIQRREGEDAPWLTILPKVKSSRIAADPRDRVTAWRWEIELVSARQAVRVRPVFTFLAVPATARRP